MQLFKKILIKVLSREDWHEIVAFGIGAGSIAHACVGLSLIFYEVTVRKKRKKMEIDFR